MKKVDEVEISKCSLQIITQKLKNKLKEKKQKNKDFELLKNYQEKLDELNSEFKQSGNNKQNLNKFVKEVCIIDKKGQVFKVLMKL